MLPIRFLWPCVLLLSLLAPCVAQPVNDNFPGESLSGESGSVGGTTVDATRETGEQSHESQSSPSVWYTWTAPITCGVEFSTCAAADFETVIAIYTGSSLGQMTLIGGDVQGGCGVAGGSRLAVQVTEGERYRIAVAGFANQRGSFTLDWRSFPSPAAYDNFPGETLSGDSGSFLGSTAGATRETGEDNHDGWDSPSVWCTWTALSTGGVEFSTCATLGLDTVLVVYTGSAVDSLSKVASDDDGCGTGKGSRLAISVTEGSVYRIAVAVRSGATGTFTLDWRSFASATNDNFPGEQLESEPGSISGSTVDATREAGEPTNAGDSSSPSVWYTWTPSATGGVEFSTCGEASFDTVFAVYTGSTVSSLNNTASDDNGCGTANRSRVAIWGEEGRVYRIAVAGKSGAKGTFTLEWRSFATSANDNFPGPALNGDYGSISGTTTNATREFGEPFHTGLSNGPSVWYSWTAPATGGVEFSTCKTADFDTVVAVYDGWEVRGLSRVQSSDNGCDTGSGSRVAIPVTEGTTYHLAVAGTSGARGAFTLDWRFASLPANDSFPGEVLRGDSGSTRGWTLAASLESGEPPHAETNSPSVWYAWRATATGRIEFSTCASTTFDTVVAVYTGESVDALSMVASDNNGCGAGKRSRVSFNVIKGTVYRISVSGGMEGAMGSYELKWAPPQHSLRRYGMGTLAVAAYSPDGRFIATCGGGGAFIWNVETGEPFREFIGHTGGVSSVAFSPDGTRLLTGSYDNTAKLWDAQTGRELQTFIGHHRTVNSVAVSSDGTRVLTGSEDSTARLWNSATGTVAQTFIGHTGHIFSVAFSPDDTHILTGAGDQSYGSDYTARLWDAWTGEVQRIFQGHNGPVKAAMFSPDGTRILTGSSDQTARIWEASTGEVLQVFGGNSYDVQSVAFSPDGTHVLTGSRYSARLWNASSGAVLQYYWHPNDLYSVAFSPDGTRVLTAADDSTARIWSAGTGEVLREFGGHTGSLRSVAFSPDATLVVTGGAGDYTARLWNASTGSLHRTFKGHISDVYAVAFSPDGSRVLTGSLDDTARLWDASTGALIQTWETDLVRSVAFSPDGTRILTGGGPGYANFDNTAHLWDVATGTALQTFTGRGYSVNSIAFSPDGTLVLTGLSNDTARIWDASTGEVLQTLAGHAYDVTSVAFSPDGTRVVTGSFDKTARIWDYSTGTVMQTLDGHPESVHSVAFSPDGTRVLTGSYPDARLWDASTGAVLRFFADHHSAVTSVMFSPDATEVVTGGFDGTSRLWELRPPRAIIVAGGGNYPGNTIAQQTHELGVYTYRTLVARGYTADSILYLSAFDQGTTFTLGGNPVSWDIDGDGIDDVDGPASREALLGAINGPFAEESGRLLVLMMNHGYKTNGFMAFRLNKSEAITTVEMNDALNILQNDAPVDVTLVVDCCYSGQFVLDCRKTDAIPAELDRIVIASTTPTTEAVFLPAPDLTSFMYTFLGSAYMGNSMGEAFRSGSRLFGAFPVAGQRPIIDDGVVQTSDSSSTATLTANREFFGASWTYGTQADKNINRFFPAFDSVAHSGTPNVPVGEAVTVTIKLLPFQQPRRIKLVVRPRAPNVVAGEPVTGLPYRILETPTGGNPTDGLIYSYTFLPVDPNPEVKFPFGDEGGYRLTATAEFDNFRLSDPEDIGLLVSNDPDPDPTEIRAVLAFASAEGITGEALALAGDYAYTSYTDKFQSSNGIKHPEWIDYLTNNASTIPTKSTRRHEQTIIKASKTRGLKTRTGLSKTALLASIDTRGAEAGRLYVHLATPDATGGILRINGEDITAAELDTKLDALQPPGSERAIIVVIDGAGSGSFLLPLAASDDQRRLIVTSSRGTDCAFFLDDPPVTFTHKLVGPLWSGASFHDSVVAARGFFTGFAGGAVGTTVVPQYSDEPMARTTWLGRRYAFAGDEASGLPFLINAEVVTDPDGRRRLRANLMQGVEPAIDGEGDRVYAQVNVEGVSCGLGSTGTPKIRLRRDGTAWTWSAPVPSTLIPPGSYPVLFQAEYPDDVETGRTRVSNADFKTLDQPETPTGSAPDAFEVDDTPATASRLYPGEQNQQRTFHDLFDEDWISLSLPSMAADGTVKPIPYQLSVPSIDLPGDAKLQISVYRDGVPNPIPPAGECAEDSDTQCFDVSPLDQFRSYTIRTEGSSAIEEFHVRVVLVDAPEDVSPAFAYSLSLGRTTGTNNGIVASIGTVRNKGIDEQLRALVVVSTAELPGVGRVNVPGSEVGYSRVEEVRILRTINLDLAVIGTERELLHTLAPPEGCDSCTVTGNFRNLLRTSPFTGPCFAFEDFVAAPPGPGEYVVSYIIEVTARDTNGDLFVNDWAYCPLQYYPELPLGSVSCPLIDPNDPTPTPTPTPQPAYWMVK